MTKRRNVKSSDNEATDCHERSKDFLNDQEMSLLLEAAQQLSHPSQKLILNLRGGFFLLPEI